MKIVITPRSSDEKQRATKKAPRPPVDDEMEEEMEWPAFQPINRSRSIFDRSALNQQDGINTAPSVFERQCVFRTGKGHG